MDSNETRNVVARVPVKAQTSPETDLNLVNPPTMGYQEVLDIMCRDKTAHVIVVINGVPWTLE